jgi:NAD(P)-dependent dehydrogenase (short-subunit alcohol dehydrogenase family)
MSNQQEVAEAFERIRRELGDTDVLLYNTAMRPFGTLMDTEPSTFENTWRVVSFGAFLAAAGGARNAPEAARRDSDYGRDRRCKAICNLGGLRAGEVRVAWPRAGDGARSWAEGDPRSMDPSMGRSIRQTASFFPDLKRRTSSSRPQWMLSRLPSNALQRGARSASSPANSLQKASAPIEVPGKASLLIKL